MDQLSFKASLYQLSSVFQQKYKKSKIFTLIVENQQLIILITQYLSVSQILTFCWLNKEINTILQKCPNIQNRILRAQVSYLTNQEQEKLKYNKFNNSQNKFAYSLFDSYFQNIPSSLSSKISRTYQANQLTTVPLRILFLFKIIKSNIQRKSLEKLKLNAKKPSNHQPDSQKKIQNSYQSEKISYCVQNDNQFQLLQKWSKMSQEKQSNLQSQKLKKYLQMPHEQRKKYVLQKFKQKNVPYQQINGPDQSLIIKKQSFWDRLKNNFSKKI